MEKECAVCGKKFQAGNIRKTYCSRKCHNKAEWIKEKSSIPIKKNCCKQCGAEYIQKSHSQFCSESCRLYFNNHRKTTLTCNRCGKRYSGSKHQSYCSEECKKAQILSNFINSFNEKYRDKLEYVSGYEHSDGKIQCRCLKCGDILRRSAQCVRRDGLQIKCHKCEAAASAKRAADIKLQHDSEQTLYEHVRIKRLFLNEQKQIIECSKRADLSLVKVCEQCGKPFSTAHNRQKYCSDRCLSRKMSHNKEIKKRKAIEENGSVDKDITLDKLIKRDKGICHICGGKCNKRDHTTDGNGSFITGATYPTIDHVHPVSKGGTHTWSNIKLAHYRCNTVKGASEYYKAQSGQITLAI